MVGIYKITNTITQKSYIGQSINISQRWSDERGCAFRPAAVGYDSLLSRAMRKYGLDAFTFEVIEECTVAQLNEREQYYIHYFNTFMPNGYNMTLGGNGTRGFSSKLTAEQITAIQQELITNTCSQLEIAAKYGISKDAVTDINLGYAHFNQNLSYPLRQNQPHKYNKHYCVICGAEIGDTSTLCLNCANENNRKVKDRPDRNQLLYEVATLGFEAVGRKYGVSGKAVCKWCKWADLPTKKKELVALYQHEQLSSTGE